MPITDMGILSEFAVIRHAGTADTGIGLGLGIREQIRKIAVSAIGKACVVDAGSDECCGIVIGGSRNQRGCGETRDFAFKIKSSPFCKGSIWQNGEFSY